ncbi:8-oxo-dGTP diphosphatase [Candidatus Palauibacter soopunensis]|uniref:8-oxo-dGTP diphosphatase n=1 Tax=Candidatus Palauibacter soopunensis TaxID=3056739 RepID=UPI0023993CDE|nr:8-oxo-dGTP diphosphatase [Candidatus Palauibacter soopunensis]MDE2877590.1 8-oxo-dGTP diphosphatase [Candidatus Palauibacter soopunensis]
MQARPLATERPIPEGWEPDLHATLLFIVRGDEILLIHKKRGLGAGKLNGAGGKVEPGESTLEAAMREFEEELRARPVAPRKVGEVAFEVLSGMSILIHVFRADALVGKPVETSEATPMWTPVDDIPYDRMWEDDRHWLPHVIENRPFEAYARFQGDDMVHCRVVLFAENERLPWKLP